MDKSFLQGIKIGLGLIFTLSLFGIVFAIGFHTADEIASGSFIGNYDFSGATVQGLDLVNTTYSYSEINTGKKWVDGKPIYRKIINYTGGVSASTHTVIDPTLTDLYVERIIQIEGHALTYNTWGSTTLRRTLYNCQGTGLNLYSTEGWANEDYQFIVEYTKK